MKLSIITICNASISVYDALLTIESVKNQNYRDIEHLFCDSNNSILNNIPFDYLDSLKFYNGLIFDNYFNYFNYFNYLNYCLNKANGDIILILDPGYYFKNVDAISTIINFFNEPDLDFSYCDMVCVDDLKNEEPIIFGICNNFISLNSWAPPLSVIFFRNTVLNKLFNFNNKYNFTNVLDLLFIIFNISKYKVLYIPDQIIKKRTSLNSNNKLIKNYRMLNFLKNIIKYKIGRKILYKLFSNRFEFL